MAMTRYIVAAARPGQDLPDKPVTEKPAETRMGSGKGSPEYWVAVVKPGRILFELDEVDEAVAREALRLAMHKLPIGVNSWSVRTHRRRLKPNESC